MRSSPRNPEPIRRVRGVPDVTFTNDAGAMTGERPRVEIDANDDDRPQFDFDFAPRASPVPGEPMIETRDTADFDAFYSEARRSVGGALAVTLRDRDLATEAVDEALTRAYQRWDRVGRMDNPSGWVYRVGLNYARNRIRRLIRPGPAPATDRYELPFVDPAIDGALEQLDVKRRAVVVCRLLLGWSEADTAAALRIRPGTAKSRLHRALGELRSTLRHLDPTL